MRPNRAKRKLQEGGVVLAPSLGANSIPDLDTLDDLGALQAFDIAWIEMEHGAWTWRELSDASRVCDLWGITSMVRVNHNDPAVIGRTLDRGIQSIIIPHVSTREEVERIVRGALFAPRGMRGDGFFSRQSHGVDNYFETVNDEVMLGILLEDVEAIRNLDDILEVPHIDFYYVGASDLAQTMGPQYLGKPRHPDVQAVVENAISRIVAAGRAVGTTVNDGTVEHYLSLGCRFIRWDAMPYLYDGLRNFQTRVHATATARGARGGSTHSTMSQG